MNFYLMSGILFGTPVLLYLFLIFTKIGRDIRIAFNFGEIIKDYGDIGRNNINMMGIWQSIRLLKCAHEGEVFYVIETRAFSGVSFIKLSLEMTQKLIEIIKAADYN